MRPVAIIIGSVRAIRIGPQVAAWVKERADDQHLLKTEVVDLASWLLPMDDEPGLPVDGIYIQPHTKAWSEKIADCCGFVFVTPQYNWGYPAPLKNALDHLFREWSGKPALTISYGYHGGQKSAAQLAPVLKRLGMKPLTLQPKIMISAMMHTPGGLLRDPHVALKDHEADVDEALREMATMLANHL
ncbi:NAD(P)H-dependent FMN reductase [Granulicella aggregans]|jgi:NAD(P)H-dependent FMN reductase|uniref:NAD(P)H-dependent FMN reductase n=1 Tax=Granulicella aggregans TaxID=474949 RepID=A0A7W7ZGR8_9BACT|nr:NAD(P)H-dependent oxidoreductase [Granulicella aggregans]MBB5059640.1 NAD(P)H-dependent FMN reductase [Granulicella aggregans]